MAMDHAHCDLSGHWKDKKRAKLLFVDVVVIVVIVIVVAMILVKRGLYIFNILILKGQMLRNHGEVEVGGGCIALASMKRQKRNF